MPRRLLHLPVVLLPVVVLCVLFGAIFGQTSDAFRFVILGDRTGEAQPGVYESVWREAAAENPAFILSAGDTIEGGDDAAAPSQWQEWQRIVAPYGKIPLYLTPGNHDIWSPVSEKLYRKYAGRELHYSFDHAQAHFTVLDNSGSDELPPGELKFLEQDLQRHASQPLKFIIFHRPGWLVPVTLGDTAQPLHRLARKYGAQYIIAGHVHQMVRLELEGVTYLSLPSSGGHLRLTKRYEDGCFFHHTTVEVSGAKAEFRIREVGAPLGRGRVTTLQDWGAAGLRIR